MKYVRTAEQTVIQSEEVLIDAAVLFFQTFSRITEILMKDRDEICDNGFLLMKPFNILQIMGGVHQISHVDARMSTEGAPNQSRKNVEKCLQQQNERDKLIITKNVTFFLSALHRRFTDVDVIGLKKLDAPVSRTTAKRNVTL